MSDLAFLIIWTIRYFCYDYDDDILKERWIVLHNSQFVFYSPFEEYIGIKNDKKRDN